jgi:outer membrane protein OmpA-like peptidoglycan-associated protein/tetratricopeptide (TPR) repeat protein
VVTYFICVNDVYERVKYLILGIKTAYFQLNLLYHFNFICKRLNPHSMKVMKKKLLLLVVLLTSWLNVCYAQSSLLKQANRQYEMLAYANAIDLLEQALKSKLTDAEKIQAQIRLGHSYKQIRDMQNAERVYRDLVTKLVTPTGEDVKVYLYYAQVLASNSKYKESQQVWDKYDALQKEEDQRGKMFSKLYQDVSYLTKNAGSYNVEYLNINSGRADFSPMFYKNGIVFCSGRGENESIVKRVFNWDKSAFLDLYYLNDISSISGNKATGLGGAPANSKNSSKRGLGSDDYTEPTANDSKTIGTYGGTNINTGGGYEENPVSESDRFSRTLNTKYHEGPACFTKDGSKIIFTRNNYNNGKYKQSSDGVNKLKIYTAEEKGGNWSNVQEVPFNSDEYSTGHPTITKDDRIVYFASDMPGGFGGTDIYMVEYNGGRWGTPKNLGKNVNSKGNEMFPFVDENGQLYYASDGLPGLGDLDIFFVQIENTGLAKGNPINLGAPINSNKDDFGIITDALRKAGYFSSNRKRGGIDDDIYRFTREGSLYPCRELTVMVMDTETKMPLDSVLVEMTKGGSTENKGVDENGGFKFCVDDQQEYIFKATRKGYVANTVGYVSKGDRTDDQPSRLEIALAKLALPPTPPPVVVESPKVVEVKKPVRKLPAKTHVKGTAFAEQDNQIMEGVVVTLTNECDGSTQQYITGPDGTYDFEIDAGCDYKIEYMKESYGKGEVKIPKLPTNVKKAPKEIVKNLGLLKEGDQITIDNIYYDYNAWNIRSDAARELDKLVITLKRYPNMLVELGSHTDSRGEASANKSLSQKRAQAAVDYLVKKGIVRNRLTANGYGESMLMNKCADGVTCSEAEHQKNRRTTLKILKIN